MFIEKFSQDDCKQVFSPSMLKSKEKFWRGGACFLNHDFVIRERYKMKSGETLHLVQPNSNIYEIKECYGSWFLSGLYCGKRVTVHIFFEEATKMHAGKCEDVTVLNLVIMTPALGAEFMGRFAEDTKTSLQELMPWKEWQANRFLLSSIYESNPELEGPDPVDITWLPVLVSVAGQ